MGVRRDAVCVVREERAEMSVCDRYVERGMEMATHVLWSRQCRDPHCPGRVGMNHGVIRWCKRCKKHAIVARDVIEVPVGILPTWQEQEGLR